jgi:hypothetical protein
MKRCKNCGVPQPLQDFYRAAGTKDGLRGECKRCSSEDKRRRYLADREAAIARVKRWQQANPERVNATQRARRARPEVKRRERAGHLKRKYGLTIEEYDAMLAAQGGGCFICGRPPRDDISLHVDHDHSTGAVRGILCFCCNNALADFQEDPALLRKAVTYLAAHDPLVQEETALAQARALSLRAG